MRVEEVTTDGFGPLGRATLRLTPGLTVVLGANESAKSSWHSATYAALCGIRRGSGQHSRDREFARRHRPWDGGPWRVGARVVLDDGRAIALTHDLEGRVDCRAIDLALGRDVSGEIQNAGSIDATRWLGLGRRAFEATASIRQAELLRVRSAAGDLAELIAAAASSGEADETATAALERIAVFQRDHVGSDRVNAVKPLRQAVRAEADARRELELAQARRAEFDVHAERLEELRAEAQRADRAERLARAARLREHATELRRRADRAQELVGVLGPDAADGVTVTAEQVAAATATLVRWRNRPAVPPPGDDVAALQAELDALDPLEAGAPADPAGPGRRVRPRLWPIAAVAAGIVAFVVGLVVGEPALVGLAAAAGVAGVVGLLVGRVGRGSLPAGEVAVREDRRALLSARLQRAVEDAGRRSAALAQDAEASAALREVATAVGAPGATDDDVAAGVEMWLQREIAAADARQVAAERRRELDRLVGVGDVASLVDQARAAGDAAAAAAVGFDQAEVLRTPVVDDAALAEIHARAQASAAAVTGAAGGLAQRAESLPDISLLDERLAAAVAERERVERLKDVLDRTAEILRSAQDRVHRDIAPRLQASLVRWLPVVTAGRYVDATVDPQSLAVRVLGAGGTWREADLLSFGTAEQVYLLLRLALVEHLTAGRDTCPLLLDDVTVHADAERTRAVLDLLLEVAAERQIVLFSQEDAVAEWARERLSHIPGALIELPPLR